MHMVKSLYIVGRHHVGKTAVAIAVAAHLRDTGKSVTYFKPVGEKPHGVDTKSVVTDRDALLMKEYLSLDEDLSAICPIVRTGARFDEFLEVGHDPLADRVLSGFRAVARNRDYVVIEGASTPWTLLHVSLSAPDVTRLLDASVIGVVRFEDVTALDEVLLLNEFLHPESYDLQIVLTSVPPMLKGHVTDELPQVLEEHAIHLLGVVFQDRELFHPSIRDISEVLEARVIVGHDELGRLIGDIMVGSMAPENALRWFRRSVNKAVITSGDRADICLAAMETDTPLLILTGGIGPDVRTIARARETGTTVLVTDVDTYTAGQRVDSLTGAIHPGDREKIGVVERVVGNAIDFGLLGI